MPQVLRAIKVLVQNRLAQQLGERTRAPPEILGKASFSLGTRPILLSAHRLVPPSPSPRLSLI